MDVTPAQEKTPGAAAEVPPDRDVANVDPAAYPERELQRVADQRRPGFQAVMTRSALNDMHRHGRSSAEVEVCGVLVGNVYRDTHGPYLYIEASIKGDHAAGKTAQVTFTAETWNHINDELERSFPGRKILGWYHTHPGFGIFLSEMDLFIQNNFFPEPWQVAYVYDPRSGEDGIFVWKQGKATRDEYLVDPDTINTDPPRQREAEVPTTGTLAELSERVQWLEQKQKLLTVGLVIAAALAVASPLVVHYLLPMTRLDRIESDAVPVLEGPAPIPQSLQLPPTTAPAGER